MSYASLVLVGWRSDETLALKLLDVCVKDATARGEGTVLALAGYVTAVLNNDLGRYEAALLGAHQACAHDDLGFIGWSLAELVEPEAASSWAPLPSCDGLRNEHARVARTGRSASRLVRARC